MGDEVKKDDISADKGAKRMEELDFDDTRGGKSVFGKNLLAYAASFTCSRDSNEDRFTVQKDIFKSSKSPVSLFAIFDGHNGAGVADYCMQTLPKLISKYYVPGASHDAAVAKALHDGMLECADASLEYASDTGDISGSTAVVALVDEHFVHVSNLGDSRAVLCSEKKAIAMTKDHRPMDEEEKKMVQSLGGVVDGRFVCIKGSSEGIAVTRSFGDLKYKKPPTKILSSKPDFGRFVRDEKSEFMVLACDGLWDLLTNQRICDWIWQQIEGGLRLRHLTDMVYYIRFYEKVDLVNSRIAEAKKSGKPYDKLASDAWWQWQDNLSFVIVFFPSFPFYKFPWVHDTRRSAMLVNSVTPGKEIYVYPEYFTIGTDMPYVIRWSEVQDIHLIRTIELGEGKGSGMMFFLRLKEKLKYMDPKTKHKENREIFKVLLLDPPAYFIDEKQCEECSAEAAATPFDKFVGVLELFAGSGKIFQSVSPNLASGKHIFEQDKQKWWTFEKEGLFGHMEKFPYVPYKEIELGKVSRSKEDSRYAYSVELITFLGESYIIDCGFRGKDTLAICKFLIRNGVAIPSHLKLMEVLKDPSE